VQKIRSLSLWLITVRKLLVPSPQPAFCLPEILLSHIRRARHKAATWEVHFQVTVARLALTLGSSVLEYTGIMAFFRFISL
jgi:hypothetical protein